MPQCLKINKNVLFSTFQSSLHLTHPTWTFLDDFWRKNSIWNKCCFAAKWDILRWFFYIVNAMHFLHRVLVSMPFVKPKCLTQFDWVVEEPKQFAVSSTTRYSATLSVRWPGSIEHLASCLRRAASRAGEVKRASSSGGPSYSRSNWRKFTTTPGAQMVLIR